MGTTIETSKSDLSSQHVNDQHHYYHEGKWVSREHFYQYGFTHEKLEETKKQTNYSNEK